MPDLSLRAIFRHTLMLSAIMGAGSLAGQAHAAPQDTPQSTQASFGAWGVDLAGRDLAIVPGNNFFRYANGTYLDHLKIPADMTSYGPFNALAELSRTRVQSILDDLSAHPQAAPRSTEEKLGTFYASYMDVAEVERLGTQPLAQDMDAIRAIKDMAGFAA